MKLLAKLFGYRLVVPEYRATHYAITHAELREWLDCYPWGTLCYVRHPWWAVPTSGRAQFGPTY